MSFSRGLDGDRLAQRAAALVSRVRHYVKLEQELFAAELRRAARRLAGGVALIALAATLGLAGFIVAIAAVCVLIALVLPLWASLLIVAGGLLVLAGPLALFGTILLRAGTKTVAVTATHEAKATVEALDRVS